MPATSAMPIAGMTRSAGAYGALTTAAIEFRPNSRLVMFSGRRNEKGVTGYHFYVLRRDRLRFLRTIEQADADFSKKLKLD